MTTQLYTIHIAYMNDYVPVIYALLPNKEQITYERFCNAIRLIAPGAEPLSILIDFERAVITTVFENQGNALNIDGCFFSSQSKCSKASSKRRIKTKI